MVLDENVCSHYILFGMGNGVVSNSYIYIYCMDWIPAWLKGCVCNSHPKGQKLGDLSVYSNSGLPMTSTSVQWNAFHIFIRGEKIVQSAIILLRVG